MAALREGASLLERDVELGAIQALLRNARDGRGGMLLLEAPAGLGKSTLIAQARIFATSQDMEVLHARAHVFGRDYPFALTRGLFQRLLARTALAERRELLSGSAGGAQAVFAPPVGSGELVANERLFPILHGLMWLTSNLAERRAVLLAVDDLHWADPLSLRFLLYLCGQVTDLPVAVIAGSRPAEPDAPQELITQLRAAAATVCLRLASLTREAVGQMVRERLPTATPSFCDACVLATGGNPFLLSEFLTDVAQRGIEPDDGSVEAIEQAPTSVHDTVIARLWRLGSEAVALARAVAVLGDDAHMRYATALAGVDPDHAAILASRLASMQILDDAEPLRFVHPLVGSAVHNEIAAAELAAAHHQAARLLAADGASPEGVAAHLLRADRRGEAWCVGYLRHAADRSLGQGGAESAVHYLRRALEEPPSKECRATVLVELGEAEALTAERQAVHRFQDALELLSGARDRAGVLLRLGRALHAAGRMAEASDVLKRGMHELADDDELMDELKATFLATAWLDAAHARDVEAWRAELLLLQGGRRRRTHRAVLAQTTMHELFSGEHYTKVVESATRLYDDGALLEEEGPDSLNVWIAIGCLSWSDALAPAERMIETAKAVARQQGALAASAQALYARSWPRYWQGRVSDAIADAQAAVSAWGAPGATGMYLPAAQYWLAVALIEHDDVDAAAAALRLCDAEERWGSTALYVQWRVGQAHVAFARRDWDAALEHLHTGARLLSESFPWAVNPALLPWRSLMALAAQKVGDDELAKRIAAEELDLARRFGAPRPLGIALRTAGLVEGGASGLECLQEGVAVLQRSPSKLELCRALIDLGAAQRRAGRRAEAREPLRRGLDLAHRFEARALARRADEELRATGARPRRRAASGPEALTPAERRTVELAADRLTNREIAQSLFVTVKTVEWHLRNAYAKLQIESRQEVQHVLRRSSPSN